MVVLEIARLAIKKYFFEQVYELLISFLVQTLFIIKHKLYFIIEVFTYIVRA